MAAVSSSWEIDAYLECVVEHRFELELSLVVRQNCGGLIIKSCHGSPICDGTEDQVRMGRWA